MTTYTISSEGDDGNLSQNATATTGSIVTAPSGGNLLAAVTYDWSDTNLINGLRKGFLCFRGLAIPRDATIASATLRLTVHANESTSRGASGVGIRVQAHKTADAEPPASNAAANAQLAALTTAYVDAITDGWAALEQKTFDVSAVIQELVNQASWASGNDVVFWLQAYGYPTTNNQWDRIGASFKDWASGQEWSWLEISVAAARPLTLSLLGVG